MSVKKMRTIALLILLLLPVRLAIAQTETPNVVLIISDDQGWSDYGFMGHKTIQTPNIDQLAKQSVVFPRGYVPTALCRPSLATLITGHYAHRHGITGNDPSFQYGARGSREHNQKCQEVIDFLQKFKTLPQHLSTQGYVSHQSGKWWEGHFRNGGFDEGMTRGFPQPSGRHGDDGLTIGRKGIKPVKDFIDRSVQKGKPFFIWFAPFLPHTPHNPPNRILKKYEAPDRPNTVAKYFAMCEWFDETCGELLSFLEKKQLADNTLVVYVTDNGWIQNPQKNGYSPRSKQTPYEGGIRTPIMFRWPARLKPAKRQDIVSSIDIFPTILSACDIEPDQQLPGLDLMDHLERGIGINRLAHFGEGFAHDMADIDDPEATLLYRWCIENKWKLILTYDGKVSRYQSTHPRVIKGPQLFDLTKDPWEQNNLANGHPEVVERLVRRIDNWYPVSNRKTIKKPEP